MSFGKTIQLHHTHATDAKPIPVIGLGTWQSKPGEVALAVEHAVRSGYKHLDLAMIYRNQEEVGAALKKVFADGYKREDLFITSKVWNSAHRKDEVEKELDETLAQLGLDYLDLYLIHWPVAFKSGNTVNRFFPPHPETGKIDIDNEVSLVETWKAMTELPSTKVKAIGVSNFSNAQIDAIVAATGKFPSVNQIEAHPYLLQDELVAYHKEKKIHITAYSPLGNNSLGITRLTDVPLVKEIAVKLNADPAQVLVAWGVYRGYSVIPKSVQPNRIDSNFQQVELSKDDYEKLTKFGSENQVRLNIPHLTEDWPINIFGDAREAQAPFKAKLE